MPAAYADVPGYLLVFPVVYGAMAYFALAMARHLRVFAAAGPSSPFASVPRRTAGLIVYSLVQARMFRDARAGLMHLAIFWGFVALTVGTADIITRRPRAGDRRLARRRRVVDRADGAPERGGRRGAPRRRVRRLAEAGHAPTPPGPHPRRARHPGPDRRRRGHRAGGDGARRGPVGRPARRDRRERARGAVAHPRPGAPPGRVRGVLVGPYRAGGGLHLLPAGQQAPPHRHQLLQRLPAQARPARPAPGHGPGGGRRDVRRADDRRPRLEGSARRLHLHRMRTLHGGLPGQRDRASRSTRAP